MMASELTQKRAEIKTRTTNSIKSKAAAVYAHWGINLNDAINMFLVKSIEVGGLPFNLRVETPPYDELAAVAYKAPLDPEGIAVLPAEWDEDHE